MPAFTLNWGASKAATTVIGGAGGLQGVLPPQFQNLGVGRPPVMLDKQAQAAQKAAEIKRQMESMSHLFGKK